MQKDKIKFSQVIGRILARIQHIIDSVIFWAFVMLKKKSSQKKDSDNKVLKTSKQIGNFFGEAGSEYYREYEKLKRKKDK